MCLVKRRFGDGSVGARLHGRGPYGIGHRNHKRDEQECGRNCAHHQERAENRELHQCKTQENGIRVPVEVRFCLISGGGE